MSVDVKRDKLCGHLANGKGVYRSTYGITSLLIAKSSISCVSSLLLSSVACVPCIQHLVAGNMIVL